MKNNNGATLISTILYVLVATMLISFIAVITTNLRKNVTNMETYMAKFPEVNKMSMHLLEEVNKINNGILFKSGDGTYIQFEQGNKYIFKDGILYKNTYKVAENIDECTFSIDQQGGKIVLIAKLKMDGVENINKYVYKSNN